MFVTLYTLSIYPSPLHSWDDISRTLFVNSPEFKTIFTIRLPSPPPPPLNLLLLPYVSVIRVNNPKCIHTFQQKQTWHFWCMYALIQHSPEQTLCTLLLTTKRNSFITNVSPLYMKLIFLAGISKNLICIYALLCAQFLAKYFQSL